MVSIGKKEQIQSENISINKKNVSTGTLDGVFAELFTLADLKPNNVQTDINIIQNKNNKTENNLLSKEDLIVEKDEKILDVAKSLISIFYKDIETKDNYISPMNLQEKSNKENINNKAIINQSVSNSKNLNENKNKNSNLPLNEFEKEELISRKISENIIGKKKSKDINQDFQQSNHKKKQELNFNLKDNDYKFSKTSRNKENISGVALNKNLSDLSQRQLNKKEKKSNKIKINVNFENKEVKSSKELIFNQLQNLNVKKSLEKNLNNVEKINIIKNSTNKAPVNKPELSNNSQDKQEILDLMESAWGEKFIRTIRNNINKGINKIDISLNPKNLGKLKIELEVIDDKTEIKINTENKQAANILNENHQKLSEMMDKENLRLGNFSSMLGENNEKKNNEKQNGEDSNEKKSSIKEESDIKERENITKTKKSNHKVDKIA